jgi:glycosyltransferase involved in cell wall biosynthesis
VFDQHDVCPELFAAKGGGSRWFDRSLRLLERLSYRTADLIVAPNESYRRRALDARRRRGADVVVVRSGPDTVEPGSGDRPDGPAVVVYAGAMDTQDGTHLLIEAAGEILRRRPDAIVVELIGAGDAVEQLRARAEELGIDDRVSWTGWLTGEAFRDRLKRATIAVSADEETPFTLLSTMTKVTDYLGAGVATVAADLPENRATAADAAVFYPPGDVGALARAIEGLVDDDETRRALAARARTRARQLLWEHSRERLLDGYRLGLGLDVAEVTATSSS